VNKTLAELAKHVGGEVVGDGQVIIQRVAPIDEAGVGAITFLANPRYRRFLSGCQASAVIVGADVVRGLPLRAGKGYLAAADPYWAFAKILQLFHVAPQFSRTVSGLAHVDPTAELGEAVTILPQAYISGGVKIGRRTVLYPGVFLGEDSEVGEDCVLHPNVVVREGCRIGDRVILHAGAVIGSDGFGYAGDGDGRIKIPQIGIVVVEDDVEIGANTTVDRATFGRTVIARGAKIDNLVQIGHNVMIGENSVIAAQVGIAGSSRVGKNVTLAGQVGVVNHVQIGDGATIGPQSGIAQSVAAGAVLSSGLPAAPHREWLKVMTLLPRLPKLWSSVRGLERKLIEIAKGEGAKL
jgi:UDP-3-O-[3-hydroxymyristoyl] glucosamine N-acyltransferase